MKKQIEDALMVLRDQPLWSAGRAADLAWFQFGERRTVKDYRGNPKVVGEYALHVQTPWRIIREDRVIVGSNDLCDPATENDSEGEDFDWAASSPYGMDAKLTALFENETRQFLTRNIQIGEAGSFSIIFNDGYSLGVFPDGSSKREYWRLFNPYQGTAHFVFESRAEI